MKLSECKNKAEYLVSEVVESDFDSKLMEYGIVPGATIKVLNRAPFSGPIFLAIGSQRIAIRKNEASYILIE